MNLIKLNDEKPATYKYIIECPNLRLSDCAVIAVKDAGEGESERDWRRAVTLAGKRAHLPASKFVAGEAIVGGGADKSAVASNQANGQISAYITKIEETTRIWSNKKTTNIRKRK
jgi:CelD/BcsL family acetyltransferase involved in cellulose biosynthesis